jgi:hypothetical protein
MADPFALGANKVDAVDAFIDFFPVEHATFELFYADP